MRIHFIVNPNIKEKVNQTCFTLVQKFNGSGWKLLNLEARQLCEAISAQ